MMLISDIGEIVSSYQELNKLDIQIESAKSGKITVSVNGTNGGPEMADYVLHTVVEYLRTQRAAIVRDLMRRGFEE